MTILITFTIWNLLLNKNGNSNRLHRKENKFKWLSMHTDVHFCSFFYLQMCLKKKKVENTIPTTIYYPTITKQELLIQWNFTFVGCL